MSYFWFLAWALTAGYAVYVARKRQPAQHTTINAHATWVVSFDEKSAIQFETVRRDIEAVLAQCAPRISGIAGGVDAETQPKEQKS